MHLKSACFGTQFFVKSTVPDDLKLALAALAKKHQAPNGPTKVTLEPAKYSTNNTPQYVLRGVYPAKAPFDSHSYSISVTTPEQLPDAFEQLKQHQSHLQQSIKKPLNTFA
ncbi:MAG: hypothetical protein VKJ06_04400 [Vampirovibrionales bacterium]|nr:hypothetical protein [Vampirovibrionales bacterium]